MPGDMIFVAEDEIGTIIDEQFDRLLSVPMSYRCEAPFLTCARDERRLVCPVCPPGMD